MSKARQTRAFRVAQAASSEALLATHLPDVRWLTGFTGSNAAVLLTKGKATLFTDSRYTQQAREETFGSRCKVVIVKGLAATAAVTHAIELSIRRVAFDPDHTTVAELDALRAAVPGGLRKGFFEGLPSAIANLRQRKDESEIDRMRAAALLGCHLFERLLAEIRPGVPESTIAAKLEYSARQAGAEGMSFDTIVAAGPRSALPHGRATGAPLPRRGFVVIDFGVILDGYCSDMTRTVHIGKATAEERFAYDSVLEAQQAAIASVAPRVLCGTVDSAARKVLEGADLAQHFTHSTGHGVGIEIHEGPRIAAGQQQPLDPGMVITIEPGIYIEGKFGIRIEDMVAVTRQGGEVLTLFPTAWLNL